ncbi:hypothetical protein BLNAU_5873 [Blattamonas nauphoetae]|uniref:Protein kinase domain-containing protein n=1 Tax=Blattamonas nauphoetae TaxID=2049346 RepID=A0ABQ9Y5U4_9EUKA|nr:hypothetical protein BLNAU_5873 [Blattamonas nauphoetae]
MVTLSTSTLENITTHSHQPRRERHPQLAQKIVSSTLSSSSGNIWSAVSLGMNSGGSFSVVNSSFSHISPSVHQSTSPAFTPNQYPHSYYQTSYDQTHSEMAMNNFARCLFRCVAYDQPVLIFEVPGAIDMGMMECLFIDCCLQQSSPDSSESLISFIFPPNQGRVNFDNVLFLNIDTQSAPCLLIEGMHQLMFSCVSFDKIQSQERAVCEFNLNENIYLQEVCYSECSVPDSQYILILQDSTIKSCPNLNFRGNFWDNELSVIGCTIEIPDVRLGTTDRMNPSHGLEQVQWWIDLQGIDSSIDQDGQIVITPKLSSIPQNPTNLMLVAVGEQNHEPIAILLVFIWMDGKYQLSHPIDSSSTPEMSALSIESVSMPEFAVQHYSPVFLVSQQTVLVMSPGINMQMEDNWRFSVSFMCESFKGNTFNFTAESGSGSFTLEHHFEDDCEFCLDIPIGKSLDEAFCPGSDVSLSLTSNQISADWFVLDPKNFPIPVNHQLTQVTEYPVLNEDGTFFIFVDGVNLKNHKIAITLNETTFSESVPFKGETGQFKFNTNLNGDIPALDIGSEYSITSFTVDGYSFIPSTPLSFTVPFPKLDEVQVIPSSKVDGKKFTVSFYTKELFDMKITLKVSRPGASHQEFLNFDSFGKSELIIEDVSTHSFYTYDTTYTLFVLARPLIFEVSLSQNWFYIPQKLEKTITILSPDYINQGEYVVINLVESNIGSFPVNITFGNINDPSDNYTCTTTFANSFASVSASVYSRVGGVPDLKWGETYKIIQVSDQDGMIDDLLTVGEARIMEEPTRVTALSVRCSSDKAFLTFEGIKFPSTFGFNLHDNIIITKNSQSLQSNIYVYDYTGSSSSSTKASSIVPARLAPMTSNEDEHVLFGDTYRFDGQNMYSRVEQVHIPYPADVTSITLVATPSPTSFCLKVVGENFEAGDRFRMAIVESVDYVESNAAFMFEVIVEMSGSEEGLSTRFELGLPSTLEFGKNYSVSSLTLATQEEFVVLTSQKFTTPHKPAQMEIFVDGKTGVDGDGCGGVSAPCQTLDKALTIVESISIETVKVYVTNKVTLSMSHVIPTEFLLIVDQNGETGSILIPSNASTTSPLLVSSGGMLKLRNLPISIESVSSDLCLLSSSETAVELNNLRVTGPLLPTTSNSEPVDEMGVCEWETGLVKVSGESIVVIGSNFSRIHQGVFFISNSTLTLQNSHLLSNSAGLDKFPSLQRNVRCVNEGRIDVLSDEEANKQASLHWISSDGCSVVIGDEESASPFVMPTLDVASSGGEQKKTKDAVKVRIVGEQLIPCAVSLELLDSSTTHKATPTTTTVLLSGAHVETCTDTLVVLSLTLDDVSLDWTNEWEGRLLFGSSLVTDSFVVKKSARELRSENAKKAMSWVIPVVVAVVALLIVVIVVIVILWRRKHNKKEEGQEMGDAYQVEIDEKMEVAVTDHQISTNPNNSMIHSLSNQPATKEAEVDSDPLLDFVDQIEALACGVGIETVIVNKQNTLYNRLHSEEKGGIVKRTVQGQIVRGLKMLAQKDRNAPIFLTLTSHNIVFDSNGRVCFKTTADIVQPTLDTLEPQIAPPPGVEFEDKAMEERAHKKDEMSESQRWLAPEVIEKKENIDNTKASVFSLGLLLWEVETGQVPYGEQDGVNASRQIVAGTLPKMDVIGLDSMKDLITDCMALDPKQRPTLSIVSGCLCHNAACIHKDVQVGRRTSRHFERINESLLDLVIGLQIQQKFRSIMLKTGIKN